MTGPDGTGSADRKFVSNSGRVVIEPRDWVFEYCGKVSSKRTPEGWKVRWKVLPLFADSYESPRVTDSSREHATTVAQGLRNAKHTLELSVVGRRKPEIEAVRVSRPLFR